MALSERDFSLSQRQVKRLVRRYRDSWLAGFARKGMFFAAPGSLKSMARPTGECFLDPSWLRISGERKLQLPDKKSTLRPCQSSVSFCFPLLGRLHSPSRVHAINRRREDTYLNAKSPSRRRYNGANAFRPTKLSYNS